MVKLAFLILAAGLAAAQPAQAAQWRVASTSGDQPHRVVYLVDTDRVDRDGDDIRFWTQTIFERAPANQDWDRSVTLRHGNCAEISTTIMQNSFYSSGRLLETDTQQQPKIVHQPDTVMEAVLNVACGRGDYITGPIDDPESAMRAYYQNKSE